MASPNKVSSGAGTMIDWCNVRGGQPEPLCGQERWQIWLRLTSLDTVFDFTKEETFKTKIFWRIIHPWRQVECRGVVTDCEVSPVPAKFLHNNSDLDTWHVTYQDWILFYRQYMWQSCFILTSNLLKKSSQPSSMSVTLTVTLTPRMEFTFNRKKMHGANIIYGRWIFITCFPEFCFSRESDQFSPDDWEV